MTDRTDFTTPPHPLPPIALQPSWMAGARAYVSTMRRIWQIRPHAVSPRCWQWLTSGYGPPWQGTTHG
jgi:hypothetical protein